MMVIVKQYLYHCYLTLSGIKMQPKQQQQQRQLEKLLNLSEWHCVVRRSTSCPAANLRAPPLLLLFPWAVCVKHS